MKKYSISQRWINLLIFCLLSLIIYSIMYSVLYIHMCIKNEQTEEALRYEYEQISKTLVQTSDYMTEEVRNFVVTKDFIYLDDYWQEVEINKSREKVIEKLSTMKLSDNEKRNVSLAKEYSDYLMDTELRAMKLTIESLNKYENNLPEKLIRYKLNVADEQLTNDEKKQKALEILFNQEYLQGKKVISDSITNFQSSINKRLTVQMNKSKESTMEALMIQTCFLITCFILVIIVLVIFYKSFMFPITNYTNALKDTYSKTKEYNLKPEGSKELQMLAERFNLLYEDLLKANNAKSEFLATMSHEIRTPLNTITGYNQLLSTTNLTDVQKKAVDMSKFAAKNLMNIINNILDFSKLENNKFELENIVFDLREYLNNLRNVFLNEVNKRGLYFKLEIQENLPQYVCGDMTKLNQILLNIISNALKFMTEGGVRVNVSWKNLSFQKLQIKFDIEDTGIGIQKEKMEHIFEPFEQSNESITRKYGGTGLGLAICKKLAQLFDGDVSVKSIYGVGSTFSVVIKLQRALNKQPENGENKKYKDKKVDFKGVKILIVDDNEINCVMEKELLSYYGFKVSIVNSGIDAIKICESRYFNLILMDIRMGGMDGYETTRKIRNRGLCTKSYIMALSADGVSVVNNKEKNLGIDDFITKPLDIELMISKLKKIFNYDEYQSHYEMVNKKQNKSYESKEEVIEEWSYINREKAILNLDNNERLYFDILNRFAKNYRDKMSEIKVLLYDRKYLKADNELHTLKGISGSIGAEKLQKSIIEFRECLMSQKYEDINQTFNQLYKLYKNTFEEIDQVLENLIKKHEKELNISDKGGQISNISNEAKNIIEEIRVSMEEGNVEVIDIFNKNEKQIKMYFSNEQFEQLKNAIESYDMAEGLKILEVGDENV